MNYKETLFFVAKSLTISFEEKNKNEIEMILKTKDLDWDAVVKLSTSHCVFPAIYCNFKRANFLRYLPNDLVDYMKYITDLNRERNTQIIKQAKELNSLLLENSIKPIFLKGTGNLLAGIYCDIAERMVGDIDFIFSKDDYLKAITVLRNRGYFDILNTDIEYPQFKHYQRLIKDNNIAAIEIHKELLIEKYANEFNYSFVEKDNQFKNGVFVLSYENKLNLSIISNQIDDNAYYFKTINLRNAYDIFLLSKKINAKAAINKVDKLNRKLNYYLAVCYEVFNKVSSLEYNRTKKTSAYLSIFKSQYANWEKTKRKHNIIRILIRLKVRLIFLYNCTHRKDYISYLLMKVRQNPLDAFLRFLGFNFNKPDTSLTNSKSYKRF